MNGSSSDLRCNYCFTSNYVLQSCNITSQDNGCPGHSFDFEQWCFTYKTVVHSALQTLSRPLKFIHIDSVPDHKHQSSLKNKRTFHGKKVNKTPVRKMINYNLFITERIVEWILIKYIHSSIYGSANIQSNL
jgi:hypothetical protein